MFQSAIKQTLNVTAQLGGNYGLSEGHRAINYLVTRDAELYETVARQLAEGAPLNSVAVRPSSLSGSRRVVDVVLSFRVRRNDAVRAYFARVDVSDLFPFLVAPIAPYIAMP